MAVLVHPFFDPETFSYSYVVVEPRSGAAAVIDPVLNFDPCSGAVDTRSADEIVEFTRANRLDVVWLLETHVHADHVSAARHLSKRWPGAATAIGAEVVQVQSRFADLAAGCVRPDGHQWDRLLADGDAIPLGETRIHVLHTPGHTPACVTYVCDGCAFVGDTLFMPDYGTARCDFPGGDARALYRSIQRIFALPDDTRLFMCHDYGPNGRHYRYLTTVAHEKSCNVHLGACSGEDEFVARRTARDATLNPPKLMIPAVTANIQAGALGAAPAAAS